MRPYNVYTYVKGKSITKIMRFSLVHACVTTMCYNGTNAHSLLYIHHPYHFPCENHFMAAGHLVITDCQVPSAFL